MRACVIDYPARIVSGRLSGAARACLGRAAHPGALADQVRTGVLFAAVLRGVAVRAMRGIAVAALLLATGCDYNRFDPPQPEPADVPVPSMEIGTLRGLYRGKPIRVVGKNSVVVSGMVTTSDRGGNFFRSFFIEDPTGAVEIRAGLYDLCNIYRIGQQVVVRADSLTLGMTGGVLQLGLTSDTYETDYMDSRVVVDRHVFRTETFDTPIPRPVTPAALREEWLGTLVRFDGLYLDGAVDTTWAISEALSPTATPQNVSLKFRTTPAAVFASASGALSPTAPADSIYVFTSGYASFAAQPVPYGPVSITGILMQGKVGGKTVYQVKIRDLDDVRKN